MAVLFCWKCLGSHRLKIFGGIERVVTATQIFVLLVLIIPLVLVFLDRLREDVAALLMAAALGLAQFLGLGVLGPANDPAAASKAIEGFGTPEVVTLLSLFILTYCLDKYGLTRWLAIRMLKIGGRSETRLIALFAISGAVLSLFMNTLAAAALLLPSALEAARRTDVKPSKLLIPLAYGTMLGGAATYLTTANIVVSGLLPLANPPQTPLGFFDFTPTGGLVAIAGLAFLIITSKWLMPNREPPASQIAHSVEDLTRAFQLQDRLWDVEIANSAAFINETIAQTRIGELGLSVLGVRRDNHIIPIHAVGRFVSGDVLIVIGREERVVQLKQDGVTVRPLDPNHVIEIGNAAMAEVLVPPRAAVEGKTLRDVAFRSLSGFSAIALWRDNRSYRTDVATFELQPGDSLLLVGPQDRVADLQKQRDFVVVETTRSENAMDVPRALATLGIALITLVAMTLGVRVEIATLGAAAALLLLGLVKPDEAYGSIKWRAIFLIAGTLSISQAMVQTGLASMVGDVVVGVVSPWGPLGLVAGTYLLSATLTQLMGGQISPLVVGPIAISAAIRLGVNPQAIAVVTAIAGSVSFITPLSHPVNILMIAPANYKFSDFVKSGWLLTVVCFIALMIAVPLFWKLQ